ncbi:MAG: LacI family DNA-binding transcriptional regulator [Ardenticatenaceae bacterium]|nr:LacI family DNA-binding transcriptional regulator [Ardenticatenaceae bacterium]
MNPKPTRTTIKEVAAVAGVSTMTVSRVLNDRPDVSLTTRMRIKRIIEELEYQPSAIARSLIQQKSYTLGVVTAGLEHIGPSRILNGITRAAEEAGYAILLKELSDSQVANPTPIFQKLLSRHVDGIIWAVAEIGENHKWLENSSLPLETPTVFLTTEPNKTQTTVLIDNYYGAQLAMAHLFEQGCRNIGHIAGPLDWWEARQRMSAWKDFLIGHNMPVKDAYWVEGDWSSASGIPAAAKLLTQYPEIDAIFVANDQMALSALQVLHKRGIRIPAEIAIVGFDNIPESACFYPALTTIQQNQHELACVAVQQMIQIIEQGWQGKDIGAPQSIVLLPTLIARESSIRQKS